jgi:superfamily II DNA/RNA helicase
VRALDALSHGRTLPKRDYRRAFAHEEDRDSFQQVLFWELFAEPGTADPGEIRDEIKRLESISERLAQSTCEKRKQLLQLIRESTDPILIFTASAATAHDLGAAIQSIRKCGVVTARVQKRALMLYEFQRGRLDTLVCTDLASEGLDLQTAGTVIHYDIPWNPVKLDQRNGRAFRIGQKRASVKAIYFLPMTRDTRIVETVARKTRERRRTLAHAPAPQSPTAVTTLRQRLASDAAYHRLRSATASSLDPLLERRHKRGIELMIEDLARGKPDPQQIEQLLEVVRREK